MPTYSATVPGVITGTSYSNRQIFTQPQKVEFAPSFVTIDGTNSRDTGSTPTSLLRAGNLMGKVTSTGKYRNSVIGLTGADYTSGGTSITVSAAVATEVARLIAAAGASITLYFIGPPSAAGTVAVTSQTCSAASGTTLTVTSLGVNKASGSIIAASDGSGTPRTVLPFVAGIDVTDQNSASIDQKLPLLASKADIVTTNIPFYSSMDTSVQTWVKAQLVATGLFTFDDNR